jgi:HEAT repeat protein
MSCKQVVTFVIALAAAAPAVAQTLPPMPPAPPVGAVPPMPPLPPMGVIPPMPPMPPLPLMELPGRMELLGLMEHLGPMELGPMEFPPFGPGPMGPGPIGLPPFGEGPAGLGPLAFALPFSGELTEQDREIERQEREKEKAERDKERQEQAREREADLYERGMEATYENRYERAVDAFSRLADLKGARTDAALYWKAYSQNRLGQRTEALATIDALAKGYPASRYIKEAKALEVEVRNTSGQKVTPETQADEDMKLLAIQGLQHTAPDQAVPMLEKLLQGPASPRVKERALYVLALSNSARAREVLKNIAKGSHTPELQMRAINYLGVHGGPESRAALAEIYAATSEVDVKRRILRAFMVSGEKGRLLTAAQTEKDPTLRATAVDQLGVMGAHDELWQLYQKESSVDVKKQIIRAMFVGGNATRLIELAKGEQNPELRLTAVRNLGVMGSKQGGDALVDIYNTDKDPAIKKAVLHSLFVSDNAAALVALARKEQDVAMKKAIVERLSHMDDKVATAYMMELLSK